MRLYLVPSKLAEYFEIGCTGFLLPTKLENKDEAVNWDSGIAATDDGALTPKEEGEQWQNAVRKALEDEDILLINNGGNITDAEALYSFIDENLGTKNEGSFLYLDDQSFDLNMTEMIAGDHEAVWSVFRPDFILVRKVNDEKGYHYLLQIGDVKSSKHMRIEHKMQVAVYAYLFEKLLKNDDRFEVDLNRGFIQLSEFELVNQQMVYERELSEEEKEGTASIGSGFDLRPALSFLKTFIDEELNGVLSCLSEEGPLFGYERYLFSEGCKNCPKFELCMAKAKEKADLRLMPYMSTLAQKQWLDLGLPTSLHKEDGTAMTFDEFSDLYSNRETREDLCNNSFWNGNLRGPKEIWKRVYESLVQEYEAPETQNEEVNWDYIKYGNRGTLSIPKESDVSLFVQINTARGLGGTTELTAYEMNAVINNPEAVSMGWENNRKHYAASSEGTNLTGDFIRELYSIFSGFYEKADLGMVFSLRIYMLNQKCMDFLYNTLFEFLEMGTPEEQNMSKEILNYLQSERLILSTDHPEKIIPYPMTGLMNEVQSLYIIPSLMNYKIEDVMKTFGCGEEDLAISEVQKMEWILNKIQANDFKRLYALNRPFKRPNSDLIENVYLSKLYYLVLQEIQKTEQESIDFLMMPDYEMISRGRAMRLYRPEIRTLRNASGKSVRKIFFRGSATRNTENADNQNAGFDEALIDMIQNNNLEVKRTRNWILIPNSESALASLREAVLSDSEDNGGSVNLNTVEINIFTDEEGGKSYHISDNAICHINAKGNAEEDHRQILECVEQHPEYGYLAVKQGEIAKTLRNILIDIKRIDAKHRGDADVSSWYPKYNLEQENTFQLTKDLSEYGKLSYGGNQTNFTTSQYEAFLQFYRNNITLLQGPPGTGKTDFIARTLIAMARIHREKMQEDVDLKPLRVYVSANSHAAINNVLNKVAFYRENDIYDLITLKKCETADANLDEDVEVIPLKDIRNAKRIPVDVKMNPETREPILPGYSMHIMGGTMWFAGKLKRSALPGEEIDFNPDGFDYIIIDEASQMTAFQALDLFEHGKPDTKYMIVGDPLQLPAILRGKYEKRAQELDITSSVYSLMDSLEHREDFHKMIREDFRMNRVILDYIGQLYEGYAPFAPASNPTFVSERKLSPLTEQQAALARRWLTLVNEETQSYLDEIVKQIIDPEVPLVVCYLSGSNARQKKEAEVELVTLITEMLYEIYEETLPERYGIIIPHHEHIDRVKEAIPNTSLSGAVEESLIIDTVDKLQGQEKDIILCSYGVTDSEKIFKEIDFIYSLNRLNVSLSRAKRKSIIIMSDTLSKRPIESLAYDEDGSRMEGINFLCGLETYVKDIFEAHGKTPVTGRMRETTVTCYGIGFDDV